MQIPWIRLQLFSYHSYKRTDKKGDDANTMIWLKKSDSRAMLAKERSVDSWEPGELSNAVQVQALYP